MREVKGNIWDFYSAGAWVVVPVNVGWQSSGANVMGRGLAAQAARRFPELPMMWGNICRALKEKVTTSVFPTYRAVCFPTKPLRAATPWASWKQDATVRCIERSARDLATIFENDGPYRGDVALPLVGTGNGNLKENQVLPVLHKHLGSDRFVLVRRLREVS